MQIKVNQYSIFMVNLTSAIIITLTIFISSLSWANESLHVNKKHSFDDKIAYADSIRSSHPKEFLVLVNELNLQAYNLSSSQQYTLDYLNLYLLIYQGNLSEAITSSEALINSNAGTLLKFRAKIGLVNIFAINQNWSEGLSTLSSILTELPSIQDEKTYHITLLVTSLFYMQLGQYNLSMDYAKKVKLSSNHGRDICLAKSYIIKSSFKLKQLIPENPIIRDAISLCRIHKEHLYISLINSYVAKMHLENQQQDKALQLLSTTLQDTLNTKYLPIIAEYYSLLAQIHWLNENMELTKKFALKSLKNEKNEGTTAAKVLSYKLLFKVSKRQKDYESALDYHQQYAIADKLYYDDIQAKHFAFQLAEHQAIEQDNKIDLLNKQNSLLTAEQALIKANAENTRLIIIVLILTLAMLIFWGIRLLKAHKRIKELAEYDALTGVFNRGHFTQVADSAIEYCKNSEQALSVIMFDLDHFKRINDKYGHACGDWALKKTIAACKKISRQNDILARLGGEEFCILLTSCDSQSAQLRAEAFRKTIADMNTAESGFDFTITASFGITDANTSGFNLESLLADADSAAYAAKHAGRNQIIVFKPEVPQEEVVILDDSRNPF